MIQQFVSVTEARSRWKELVDLVVSGKAYVVLVRRSKPVVVMMPYSKATKPKI